jgi:hypothetical protein
MRCIGFGNIVILKNANESALTAEENHQTTYLSINAEDIGGAVGPLK